MGLGKTQSEQGGSHSRKRKRQISNSNYLMMNKYEKILDKEASLPNSTIPQNGALYTVVHFHSSLHRERQVDCRRESMVHFLMIITSCNRSPKSYHHSYLQGPSNLNWTSVITQILVDQTTIDCLHITNPHICLIFFIHKVFSSLLSLCIWIMV